MDTVKWNFLGACAVLLVLSVPVGSGDRIVVLNGLPFMKAVTLAEGSNNFELTSKQQQEYRLLITKEVVDGQSRYFWVTRGDKELSGP